MCIALFTEIPAMTLGPLFDAIIPVTAMRRLRVWSGQAVVSALSIFGASGIVQYGDEAGTCEDAREDG
jgi:hypothetical protein